MKHLFLDLEDTVITPVVNGWFNVQLINSWKIELLLERIQPDEVSLFSFAIHNQSELGRFNTALRDWLQNRYGFKLSLTPTVDDDILPACCRAMGVAREAVNFSDLVDFWGKQQAFRLWAQQTLSAKWNSSVCEDTEIFLIDDVVMDETFHWPEHKIKGTIINIDRMV